MTFPSVSLPARASGGPSAPRAARVPRKRSAGTRALRDGAENLRGRLSLELPRAVLQEVVDKLGGRVVHLDDEAIDLAREVVEEPHGGPGRGQAESRRQERLGDAARDRADTRRLGGLH